MTQPPREVLQWIQNLGLSVKIKNAKWDLADGRAVAEILHIYFPEANIKVLNDSRRSKERQQNWQLLVPVMNTLNLRPSHRIVEGTMNFMNDAAVSLLQNLYEQLSTKSLRNKQEGNRNFTTFTYHKTLPLCARPTLATALKSNLRPYYKTLRLNNRWDKKKRIQVIMSQYSHLKRNWISKQGADYPRFTIPINERVKRVSPRESAVTQTLTDPVDTSKIGTSRASLDTRFSVSTAYSQTSIAIN